MYDANKLKNKRINIWVYEASEKMFTGVELEKVPELDERPGIKTNKSGKIYLL